MSRFFLGLVLLCNSNIFANDFMQARMRRFEKMSSYKKDTTVILKDEIGDLYIRLPFYYGCNRSLLLANKHGILVHIASNYYAEDETTVARKIKAYEKWLDGQQF